MGVINQPSQLWGPTLHMVIYAPGMLYLPTELGEFVRANVGIHNHSSTMEQMGRGKTVKHIFIHI